MKPEQQVILVDDDDVVGAEGELDLGDEEVAFDGDQPTENDPYALSKAGTGMFHPAVTEIKEYVRLVLERKNGRRTF